MKDINEPLIVLYSHSGHTQQVVERFAKLAGANIQRVEPRRYRTPVAWTLRALLDVATQAEPQLWRFDPEQARNRPWVLVAGPVWAGQPAAPVRSMLSRLRAVDVPVGLLLTCGKANGFARTVAKCESILGRRIVASCPVENAEQGTVRERRALKDLLGRFEDARANVAT